MANKAWNPQPQPRENGEIVEMQMPEIVSASRSTDIPAFYSDWFFHRLQIGYSAWTNPFNGVRSFVSYRNTRFIIFWSKNPKPLLKYLHILKEKNIKCYIQYSLNDYTDEHLEKVPPLSERIETFKQLTDVLGKGCVVWRFDPLMLTDEIDIDKLLKKIENIGDQLMGYTEKLVFSFADILEYRKVKNNLEKSNIHYNVWTEELMYEFAKRLSEMNKSKGWNYELATCGERLNNKENEPMSLFSLYGIKKNHCIDDDLIIRIAHEDKVLMDFLGVKKHIIETNLFGESEPPKGATIISPTLYATKGDNRDKGQRELCGCMKSKDVGEYNTCPHLCEYCYANSSKQTAINNYRQHKNNPNSETITGR